MDQLQQLLDKKTLINHLDLSGLWIGIQGTKALTEALNINTITKLNLRINAIKNSINLTIKQKLKI